MKIEIQCTTPRRDGPGGETQAYAFFANFPEDVMPQTDSVTLALALADTLPRSADRRAELVALGMVATAIICEGPEDERAELVETFCNILRAGAAQQLN